MFEKDELNKIDEKLKDVNKKLKKLHENIKKNNCKEIKIEKIKEKIREVLDSINSKL